MWTVADAGTDGNGRRMLRTQQIAQIVSATFHRLCATESGPVSDLLAGAPCCISSIELRKRPLNRSSIARNIRGGVRHPHQVILARCHRRCLSTTRVCFGLRRWTFRGILCSAAIPIPIPIPRWLYLLFPLLFFPLLSAPRFASLHRTHLAAFDRLKEGI